MGKRRKPKKPGRKEAARRKKISASLRLYHRLKRQGAKVVTKPERLRLARAAKISETTLRSRRAIERAQQAVEALGELLRGTGRPGLPPGRIFDFTELPEAYRGQLSAWRLRDVLERDPTLAFVRERIEAQPEGTVTRFEIPWEVREKGQVEPSDGGVYEILAVWRGDWQDFWDQYYDDLREEWDETIETGEFDYESGTLSLSAIS